MQKISNKAQEALLKYQWPGNVRELQHVLERAVIMSDGADITEDDLQLSPQRYAQNNTLPDEMALEDMEKMMVQKAIDKHKGNISKAAAELGLTSAALYRRIEKFGI